MPRQPRAIADSGIYHVMMRGCGKQIIFEDDLDRETFLRLAAAKLGSNDVLVLAWCLMDNHVHFLLEDLRQSLSKAVQALGTAYARYYTAARAMSATYFKTGSKAGRSRATTTCFR